MARSINALSRGELQRGLQAVNKDVARVTSAVASPDAEPVVAAAGILLAEIKRLISTPGGGKPAAPGSPPHRQSGRLRRSWKSKVVQGARRVGSGLFTASITEFGTDQEPPRPYARAAFENVQNKMTDVLVSESQRKIPTVP